MTMTLKDTILFLFYNLLNKKQNDSSKHAHMVYENHMKYVSVMWHKRTVQPSDLTGLQSHLFSVYFLIETISQ